jgi:hypothetical protein
MCFSLVGCGKENSLNGDNTNNDNTSGDNNNGSNINDNTKVSTVAQSYEKYTELKSKAYDKLSEKLNNSEDYNLSLSMGLLGFSALDLSLIPITFCGLDNQAAMAGLAILYSDITYENTNDACKITFKGEDSNMTYDTKYDAKTDSVQTKVYENNILTAISEYIKLDNGYATQFYAISDSETSVYKSIFDENMIIVSMKSKVSEPESIFKNKGIVSEDWTKSQELWSKYENGNVTSIYDGQEY